MKLIVRRLLIMFALPVMERVITRSMKSFGAKRKAAKRARNNIAKGDVVDSTITES